MSYQIFCFRYFIERTTRATPVGRPSKPSFNWQRLPTDGQYATIRVRWLPNVDRPGSHFYVKYRRVGESTFMQSDPELLEDYRDITGLENGEKYDFMVTSVDGEYVTNSDIQVVDTYDSEGPIIQPRENVATAGWFIGMMLAIAFLLLVLIMVCILKRNRGGKYAVHEREQANGRHDYQDEGGFHEYSQP